MFRITFISSVFIILKCVENCEPKALTKEGALGHMSKNFQVYFMHIVKETYSEVKKTLFLNFFFKQVLLFINE